MQSLEGSRNGVLGVPADGAVPAITDTHVEISNEEALEITEQRWEVLRKLVGYDSRG